MTAAVFTRPHTPRPTENTTGSFVLAVAMHALLFAALWINVQWRTQPEGEVVAELWGALPAPPPVEVAPPPPPPPVVTRAAEQEARDAEIALQREKEKKLAEERQRQEEQKKREAEQKKIEEERRKAEEDKRAAAQREAIRKAEAQRMQQQLAASAPTPGAAGGGRGDGSYAAQLVALIKPRIVFAVPDGTSPQVYADFQVDLLPTGEIAAVKVLRASGLPGYDAAVERAIWRTNPFPHKKDGTVERTVLIRFRPVDAQ